MKTLIPTSLLVASTALIALVPTAAAHIDCSGEDGLMHTACTTYEGVTHQFLPPSMPCSGLEGIYRTLCENGEFVGRRFHETVTCMVVTGTVGIGRC